MTSSTDRGGRLDSPAELKRLLDEGSVSVEQRLAQLEAAFDRLLHPEQPPELRVEGFPMTRLRLLAAALGLALLAGLAFGCGYAVAAGWI